VKLTPEQLADIERAWTERRRLVSTSALLAHIRAVEAELAEANARIARQTEVNASQGRGAEALARAVAEGRAAGLDDAAGRLRYRAAEDYGVMAAAFNAAAAEIECMAGSAKHALRGRP
jgi:hypothetical protein